MNGSFEVTESGLPVNWLLYTPKTVPTGDFDLVIDTTEYKEGSQSLKFVVRECSRAGGRLSPGFAQEYEAAPGDTYRVSFWVKNDGSEFVVRIRGVSAMEGDDVTIVKSQEAIDTWQAFEYDYTIPEKMNALRFEMNILQPGFSGLMTSGLKDSMTRADESPHFRRRSSLKPVSHRPSD
jgi:hypothetical protein